MDTSACAPAQGEPGWLEAIHQQWVATLDALRDAIVVIDAGGQVLRANVGFAELVGVEVNRVRGRQVDTLAPWLVDSSGRIAEEPRRSPGGKVVYARACPAEHRLQGRVYILDDVTAENALAEAERRLAEGEARSYGNVVEAMSSHRPYRPACGLHAALDEIRSGRGTRYDKGVVDACLEVLKDGIEFGGGRRQIRSDS